jgi:hypothetical protein
MEAVGALSMAFPLGIRVMIWTLERDGALVRL